MSSDILIRWNFLIVKLSVLHGRSARHIPEVSIPEDLAVNIALSLRNEINKGFAVLREIATGRDMKKFLAVCFTIFK